MNSQLWQKKNIFAYELFLSLNISDFNLFSCENCNPPWKKSPPSFPATPSKSWGPVKPPLFENLVGVSTPLAERGGGYPICTQFKSKFQWVIDRVVSLQLIYIRWLWAAQSKSNLPAVASKHLLWTHSEKTLHFQIWQKNT